MRTEAKSLLGRFWLPTRPEKQLSGTLTIKDGGSVQLEVLGTFDGDPSEWNWLFTVERIVGIVEGEQPVTLDRCIYSQKQWPIIEVPRSTLAVGIALLGLGYEADHAIGFEAFQFSIEGLDEWHSITGITVKREEPPVEILYDPPKSKTLWEADGISLALVFGWQGPSWPTITRATISQSSKFRLSGRELLGLDDFSAIAHRLVHFLCLATNETVSIRDVTAYCPNQTLPDGTKHQHVASVYYSSRSFSETPPKIDRSKMLFHLAHMPEGAQSSFDRWMRMHVRVLPAMSLYFSSRAGEYTYISSRFLSLSQALETFHRRSFDAPRMPPKDFKRMIAEIRAACPAQYLSFLDDRFIHANDPTQKERYLALLAPFARHFGTLGDQELLVKSITDTRNYFTHYDPKGKAKAAKGRNLWILCGKMETLYQLCMLREIGFTDGDVDRIVSEQNSLKQSLARAFITGDSDPED
jgi:hypothetical protein